MNMPSVPPLKIAIEFDLGTEDNVAYTVIARRGDRQIAFGTSRESGGHAVELAIASVGASASFDAAIVREALSNLRQRYYQVGDGVN